HANIELTNEGIIITDVSSAQKGIEVDGVLAKKAALKPGSKIVIGSTLIRFDIKPQNAQPPVSLPPLPSLQDSPAHIRQVVNPLPSASSRRSSSSSKTTF